MTSQVVQRVRPLRATIRALGGQRVKLPITLVRILLVTKKFFFYQIIHSSVLISLQKMAFTCLGLKMVTIQ